jgi:hypothetical protein
LVVALLVLAAFAVFAAAADMWSADASAEATIKPEVRLCVCTVENQSETLCPGFYF